MTLPKQVIDVLSGARKWAHARGRIVDLNDRKSTTQAQLQDAQKALFAASDELFKAVTAFEKFLRTFTPKKRSSTDWAAIFGAVAKGAGFLEGVAKTAKAPGRIPPIVDTVGEEV